MSDGGSQWVSVGEAATLCGISERQAWRWVRDGIVESRQEKRGQQNTRLVNRESLPEESAPVSEGVSAMSTDVSTPGRGCPDMAAVDGASQGLTGPRHTVSPRPAGVDAGALLHLVEQQRDQAKSEVEFLRAQLDRRAEEAQRQAQAEEQLRVMLVRLEQTNAQLAATLVQKALPPASEVAEVKKVRWWKWWRR